MKLTLLLLLVAVAVVLQISETRFVKQDVLVGDAPTDYDAIAAEEMAAAGGYKRIARNANEMNAADGYQEINRNAANPFAKYARSPRWCCPCCDYMCNTRRECSCCIV